MTGAASGTDFGTLSGRTQVDIVAPGHALAAGLSGRVTVTSSAQIFSGGRPNANAAIVAAGGRHDPRRDLRGDKALIPIDTSVGLCEG